MSSNGTVTPTTDEKLDQLIALVQHQQQCIDALQEVLEDGLADINGSLENLAEGGQGFSTFES